MGNIEIQSKIVGRIEAARRKAAGAADEDLRDLAAAQIAILQVLLDLAKEAGGEWELCAELDELIRESQTDQRICRNPFLQAIFPVRVRIMKAVRSELSDLISSRVMAGLRKRARPGVVIPAVSRQRAAA